MRPGWTGRHKVGPRLTAADKGARTGKTCNLCAYIYFAKSKFSEIEGDIFLRFRVYPVFLVAFWDMALSAVFIKKIDFFIFLFYNIDIIFLQEF